MSRPPRSDATAAGLRYVDPDTPGITRRRAGRGFRYLDAEGRPIHDARAIERIRSIAIPPAWTDVWICPNADGHILATGRDARGRRQYRYHPGFRSRRDDDKFSRLARFGKALPRIRRRVQRDLARRGLPREKVVAAVVRLLETTRFRVGNDEYARLNRSFGISTLRSRHASVTSATLRFRFRGKGGRTEERSVVDPRLAAVVRRCQELPGQNLFQYVDAEGQDHAVSSDDVNEYLRIVAGTDEISAKDYRTWVATVLAYRALRAGAPISEAIRRTALELNDTPTVTRTSYVHPAVLAAFDGAKLETERRAASGSATAPQRPPLDELDRRDELAVLAIVGSARRSPPVEPKAARRTKRPGA